jgi:hypothetical protein
MDGWMMDDEDLGGTGGTYPSNHFCLRTPTGFKFLAKSHLFAIMYGQLSWLSYYSEICKAVVKLLVGFSLIYLATCCTRIVEGSNSQLCTPFSKKSFVS